MATEERPLTYMEKIKGAKVYSGIPYPKWYVPIVAAVGGMIAIAVIRLLSIELELVECFIVPFGASCVLLFSAPAAPFSQPRNVIGGHIISALVGLAAFAICEEACWWSMALANGVAILLMASTKTIHPPAGATAFLPLLNGITDWSWAFVPVGIGAVILVLIALLYNNLFTHQRYPAFWW